MQPMGRGLDHFVVINAIGFKSVCTFYTHDFVFIQKYLSVINQR